jgi:hypothetical protein
MHALNEVEDIVVNCVLINNKNVYYKRVSSVVSKHIVKVFIVECNLSIKL